MTINLLTACTRVYANNGQHAEYRLAYTLTGEHRKADNKKGGADVGIYQVKSFRATLCHGDNIENLLVEYAAAERFAFVDDEKNLWYDLDKAEFLEFAKAFGEKTRDSQRNGGKVKIRLNRQTEKQRAWLNARG